MRGYIKFYRQILDNPLFTSEPFCKGFAWSAILALTNHKASYIKTKNGKMVKIERGECGYSELALSKIFKWSRGKVKRYLMLLESEKMIQQKIVENHSIIKVLNYEQYQDDTINRTINGQQTGQQTDTNNNDNNDKNDNKIISLYKNKKLNQREREILISYCKRKRIKNINAYIRKVIDNEDYILLIDDELKYQNQLSKIKEQQTSQIKIVDEDPEVTEQAYLKFQETIMNRRSKLNEKSNTMAKSIGNVEN